MQRTYKSVDVSVCNFSHHIVPFHITPLDENINNHLSSYSNSIGNSCPRLKLTLLLYRGGIFCPPYQKMAITPKNNDLNESKLCDFSYISMTNPSIPFWGLKMTKKGVSIAFLLSAVPISES